MFNLTFSAHGASDIRQPIVLKQGAPHKLHNKSADTVKQMAQATGLFSLYIINSWCCYLY